MNFKVDVIRIIHDYVTPDGSHYLLQATTETKDVQKITVYYGANRMRVGVARNTTALRKLLHISYSDAEDIFSALFPEEAN